MPFGPFIMTFFSVGVVNFMFTVAGTSLPIYETTYDGARGWSTSLWRSCLKSIAAPCRTIDEKNLRCDSLGHMLRASRAFCVLAILALAVQCGIAIAYIANFYKPTSRLPFIVTTAVNFVLVLIGSVMMLSLYTEKQCPQSLKAADEMNFLQLSVGPPLLMVSGILELLLFFATMLWPKKWADASGDKLIFSGEEFDAVAEEEKKKAAQAKKYGPNTESKADKDEEKKGK